MAKAKATAEPGVALVGTTPNKIAQLIEKANAKFGNKDRITIRLGTELPDMKYVKTGNVLVDSMVLGGKGTPQGTIIQLIGWEGAGKSRYLKSWIKSVLEQFPEKYVVVIPTERADYTPDTLVESGINPERVIIIEGACAEDSFDMLKSLLVDEQGNCMNMISMWAVDSVPGLRPKSSVKKSFSDSERMASTASLMHEVLRDLSYAQGDGIGVIVNQLRTSFSTMGLPSKPHIYGGSAMLFWPKLTLRFQKFEPKKTEGKWFEQQTDSFQITVATEKNNTSIGINGSQVYYTVHNTSSEDYDRGVSENECLVKAGIMLGLVKKSVGWHQYKTIKANGEMNFVKLLVENDLINELRDSVMELSWEKASKGRIVVDKFYVDKETGKLLAETEIDGYEVEDAGIIMEPIDLSDEEKKNEDSELATKNSVIYDTV